MPTPQGDAKRDITTLSQAGAQQLIDAVISAANAASLPVSVAVHDSAANLLAFMRMDGAGELSARIAHDKAYSSAAFGYPTHQLYELIKDDEPLKLGLVQTPRLVTFGGGYPVTSAGQVIGAIGVSGGHYTQDMAVAEAALKSCAFTD